MENEKSSLFDLGIDDVGQSYLLSTAKWNRFLAWLGIIGCSLIILLVVFGSSFFLSRMSPFGRSGFSSGYFTGALIFYVVFIGLFIIPNVYRLNFANKMLMALRTNDQQLLNESLSNLKSFSKFWGILAIIIISLYAIIFIFGLIATAMF